MTARRPYKRVRAGDGVAGLPKGPTRLCLARSIKRVAISPHRFFPRIAAGSNWDVSAQATGAHPVPRELVHTAGSTVTRVFDSIVLSFLVRVHDPTTDRMVRIV